MMKNNRHQIFKMVHLRGVDTNTITPTEDANAGALGEVIQRLQGDAVDLSNIDDELIAVLETLVDNIPISHIKATTSLLKRLLLEDENLVPRFLSKLQLLFDKESLPIDEIGNLLSFKTEFDNLYAIWIVNKLTQENPAEHLAYEEQLRCADLIYQLRLGSPIDVDSINVHKILHSPVLLPKSITRKKGNKESATTETKLTDNDGHKQYQNNLKEYNKTNAEIQDLENLQEQILKQWRISVKKIEELNTSPTKVGNYRLGALDRASTWLWGRKPKVIKNQPIAEPLLAKTFFTELKQGSPKSILPVIDELEGESNLAIGHALRTTENTRKKLIQKGSTLFDSQIVFEGNWGIYIPPSDKPPAPRKLEYAIKALGWGDLIVSTERLVKYEALEIAHIENILPGESKIRKHGRSKKIQEFTETETTEVEESEHELQTTDRYELQSESEKAIQTDFSISAGLNTSGRYGLTKVSTSLDADFSRSESESKRTTTNIAKEIVEKAVERTLKKTRELRRRNVVTEIKETNEHGFNNKLSSDNPVPKSISGVYRWVEKIHEIQLRHYGKRFMLEFHIPEPAITLTSAQPAHTRGIEPPVEFNQSINGITETNYKAFAELYQATDIAPPPELLIEVGYAWASMPDEGADADAAEDTIAEKVNIPAEYQVLAAEVVIHALPIETDSFSVQASIGGRAIALNSNPANSVHKAYVIFGAQTWPSGIPLTAIAHGHFDKTMAINIRFDCVRSDRESQIWQIETHQKLTEAYQARLIDHQDALAQAEFKNEVRESATSRPAALNRITEREELKKWSIKTLRNSLIDFNAVTTTVDGSNEIDPNIADDNARPIQFYEEAFEWEQISYFFYPYFWGNRENSQTRRSFTDTDARFESFLRSGAARVIAPITPGYEKRVLLYLSADNSTTEIDKIKLAMGLKEGETPPKIENSEYKTLWAELLQDRKDQVARGSGTLRVLENNSNVVINTDSTWSIDLVDIGREVYIRGERYEIEAIDPVANSFTLNEPYRNRDEAEAIYVTGSVPFGPSWTVNLPTNLVILDENRNKLDSIG